MTRSLKELLLFEASRKPKIAELISNIRELSEDDIDNIKVPLPWYKKALKEYKTSLVKRDEDALINEKALEYISKYVVDGVVPDGLGHLKEWRGENIYLSLDRNGNLEIKTGTALWFPDTGGVWIDTVFSKFIDPRIFNLPTISRISKTEYSDYCWKKRNSNISISSDTSSTNLVRETPLFRIYK